MEESLNKELNNINSNIEFDINEEIIGDLSADKEQCLNPYQYSPLALAYIGDSALDLIVKTYFVKHSNRQTNKYHKDVSNIVKAVNQSKFVDSILDELLEDLVNHDRNLLDEVLREDTVIEFGWD